MIKAPLRVTCARGLVAALACLAFLACNKPKKVTPTDSNQHSNSSSGYFKTQFQDESQFIVESVVTDLAEMCFFATRKTLPEPSDFRVQAKERPNSPFRAPVYDLEISLMSGKPLIKSELNVLGPIWSPETFRDVLKVLFHECGVPMQRSPAKPTNDSAILIALTDAKAETIERKNQEVSAWLDRDFCNPAAHESAALVLGAFAFRENSGTFFDIRSPLCRMAAHLAFARALAGGELQTVEGRLAEAILDTLMSNQTSALRKLDLLASETTCLPWVRVLRARNTRDYRELAKLQTPTRRERISWFENYSLAVNLNQGWKVLPQEELVTVPDFSRIANSLGCSVETGNDVVKLGLSLELREIGQIYQLAHAARLAPDRFSDELNELPVRCLTRTGAGIKVHAVSWGEWAMFFQRELGCTIEGNYRILYEKWGLQEDAKTFAKRCENLFSGLRLYPFMLRTMCGDAATYRTSVDGAIVVTVATPHLVSSGLWNQFVLPDTTSPEIYCPIPNPHINEWHKHSPPPGTAYDWLPRMYQPGLGKRPDLVPLLEKLHEIAPYDGSVCMNLARWKYSGKATCQQASAIFGPLMEYDSYVLYRVAEFATTPDEYEGLMSKAAALDSRRYFTLGEYFINQGNETKAVDYLEKGVASDEDKMSAAANAAYLIAHYLKHNNVKHARELANLAGEIYSEEGLTAKAQFHEVVGEYQAAFECYTNIEERYGDSSPLLSFCQRYKTKTNDSRFDGEARKRLGKIFPGGIQKVALKDFRKAPTDGVFVADENDLVREAGMKKGDIIVAIYGIRVHNFEQYDYGRNTSKSPQLELIVWQGGGYREIRASPPGHRFGVSFPTYSSATE